MLKKHKHMLLSIEDCENLTTMPKKITAIIATSGAPIECLAWSIFSLLTRSNKEILEHLIVVINGPDSRTGSPTLQDKKQKFLEELRMLRWDNKDMPLTLIRTWSRVGHAQSLEQAITWVHTQNYLVMHDDVILLNNKWLDEAKDFFEKEEVAAKTWRQPFYGSFATNGNTLGFPHFNSVFTLCKKPVFEELGARWPGYHIPIQFQINDLVDYEEVMHYYQSQGLIKSNKATKEKTYNIISMDIGSWIYYKLSTAGYKIDQFSDDILHHFSSGSWGSKPIINELIPWVIDLEKEIYKNKDYLDLYKRHTNYEFSTI